MSVREVSYFQVECDHPECSRSGSATLGAARVAWPSEDVALEEWEGSDGWIDIDTGEMFCSGHIPPLCEWCGKRASGQREGDAACTEHLRSEFPAEASHG